MQADKSTYGLKQAPCTWFAKLKITLLNWGFQKAKLDASFFVYASGSNFLALLVYVDDILLTRSNPQVLNKLVHDLNSIFAFKDFEELHYFLDKEVIRDSTRFYLTQSKYNSDLLTKLQMQNYKPCTTPICTSAKLACTIG